MDLHLHTSPIAPGLTVIEASAGTGKTYSISHLVPRLLLEGALPDLSRLLLVTFTKDAARELAERVRRVLTRLAAAPTADEAEAAGDVAALRTHLDPAQNADAAAARLRLDRALLDLDLLAVSTIHAFCQRTLQQEGSLCGFPVLPEVVTDDAEHLEPIVRQHWIATLSADAALAALATAHAWDLQATLQFINTRRRCPQARIEPEVTPFAQLRARVDTLCADLALVEHQNAFAQHLARVTSWNKGHTFESVRAALAPLQTPAPATLEFWQTLADIDTLPSLIAKRGAAQKALAAALPAFPWFAAASELCAVARRLLWAWQHALAAHALPALETTLAARRLITQDGLIGALHHALHRQSRQGAGQSARLAARLAERYHLALIDESQDTDPRQFAIFRRIFLDSVPRRRLLLIGDPKQAIYGFRGADLSTYLAARAEADARYTLRRTHRAPTPLVEAVNTLFARERSLHHPDMAFTRATSALAYDRQLFRAGVPCSRIEAWIVPDAEARDYSTKARRIRALSARIASTIVDLLHHGELRTFLPGDSAPNITRVTPRDFAVLVATNEQAHALAEALQTRAVPAVVNSGADVFASDEARELHTLLRGVLDARRVARLRAALATRLLGLDALALAALNLPPLSDKPEPALSDTWLARFQGWQQVWNTRGLAALLTALEAPEIAVTRRLALVPLTGERRATNYRHLTDLLLEAARDTAPRPAELLRWLGQQIARADERSQAEERQLQLSSDRAAVQVVTMHKAKGLEYPLVFCPYLAEPLRQPEGFAQMPGQPAAPEEKLVNLDLLDAVAAAERCRQIEAAQLEERLRLAYVALTRAQVRVWVCTYRVHPNVDLGSALDWLLRPKHELAAYPSYSPDWLLRVLAGGTARHAAALEELGARAEPPAAEHPSEQPAPSLTPSPSPTPLITHRPPPPVSDQRYHPPAEPEASLSAPALSNGDKFVALPAPFVPSSWHITSFSTLTRERHAHGSPALSPSAPSAPSTPAPPEPLGLGLSTPPAPLFLHAPAGAIVGTAIHGWIETWDFSPPDRAALTSAFIAARLPTPRDDQPAWTPTVIELFETLRSIRLPGCGDAPLHALCPERHGSEWHFYLPLAGSLSVAELAHCFATHAAPEHRAYAPRLAALSHETFRGLLQGFIDRLARHGSSWGVIDWKTNHLGPTLADYDGAALLRCAMDSHYLLQTHLYLVALRRYLRGIGLPEASLAGAWLVFLRALAPGQTRGVLHIDPPAAMLDALDALFAPGAVALAH